MAESSHVPQPDLRLALICIVHITCRFPRQRRAAAKISLGECALVRLRRSSSRWWESRGRYLPSHDSVGGLTRCRSETLRDIGIACACSTVTFPTNSTNFQ
ncbi:hypothetical protein BD309DRAFT_390729 [Dichomitus squalens]|uniref:Uncharacterized protein n=1 Tax=Dichomitus squalens TaxID=114155 RepID=A0A4Q9P4C8_9APHY|nr:hypothetical protein BD311DRAFT_27344 [Dichomitus squalens]TBU47987.1 hypothetical protein BD309DRAFT_390729 [Dichomitus squalens]